MPSANGVSAFAVYVQELLLSQQIGNPALDAWGPHAQSFFQGVLQASFEQRLTATGALQHPFLARMVAFLRA